MFVWRGFASPNSLDNGSRYNPTANTWNPISTIGGPPERRFGHLAAWTGSSMIVWGGSASGSPGGGSQPLGSGGICYSEPMEAASHFYLIEISNTCGSTP